MVTQIKYECTDCHEEKCNISIYIDNIKQYDRLNIHPIFCIFNDTECSWIKVVGDVRYDS